MNKLKTNDEQLKYEFRRQIVETVLYDCLWNRFDETVTEEQSKKYNTPMPDWYRKGDANPLWFKMFDEKRRQDSITHAEIHH